MNAEEVYYYLKEKKGIIEGQLTNYLPSKDKYPEIIHESMHYSVFAGGKRLRPILTLEAAELFEGQMDEVIPFACAIEFIHTYSLVHDDLPALDNDDLRRGNPTNHKVFGEANAILAGDALLNRAYEIILKQGCNGKLTPERYLNAASELSNAIGTGGMIGGQVVDIQAEGTEVDRDTLFFIHQNKTGALLVACVKVGAILAGACEEDVARLSRFAEHVGLGFQIVDDILDLTGEENKLGKKICQDQVVEKATYPKLFGLETSRQKAQEKLQKAFSELDYYGDKAVKLKSIAGFLINREF